MPLKLFRLDANLTANARRVTLAEEENVPPSADQTTFPAEATPNAQASPTKPFALAQSASTAIRTSPARPWTAERTPTARRTVLASISVVKIPAPSRTPATIHPNVRWSTTKRTVLAPRDSGAPKEPLALKVSFRYGFSGHSHYVFVK